MFLYKATQAFILLYMYFVIWLEVQKPMPQIKYLSIYVYDHWMFI